MYTNADKMFHLSTTEINLKIFLKPILEYPGRFYICIVLTVCK